MENTRTSGEKGTDRPGDGLIKGRSGMYFAINGIYDIYAANSGKNIGRKLLVWSLTETVTVIRRIVLQGIFLW